MKKLSSTIILLGGLLVLLLQPVMAVNLVSIEQSQARTAAQTLVTNFSAYSMKGLFSSVQETFWISDDWDVETVTLHLEYRATQLADTDLSSLTLAINDAYFYSLRPEDNLGKRHALDISVPREFLQEGYNNIRIDGYMRTDNTEPCVDDVSSANWLDIFAESNIAVQFDKNVFVTSIQSFYKRFFDVDSLRFGESVFVIPDTSQPAELNAALLGIAGISNQTIYPDDYFPLLTLSDPDVSKSKNRIIIALYDQLPEDYRSLADQNGINEEDAVLFLQNQGSETNTLIITAKNDVALINAGRMLGNSELMKQVNEPRKLLGKNEDIKTDVYEAETYINFAGANGTYFNGAFRQVKEFAISYPANRSLSDASEFYLNYRYSENLDFDRSLMTVFINDIPVGSRKLSPEMAGGDQALIPIPTDIDISGAFQVKVAFDLEIKDLYCTTRQGDMPWAYLTPETMVKINSAANQDLVLENYPAPFISDYRFNSVSLVVPDQLDGQTANLLAKMVRVMGRYTKGNTGELTVFYPEGIDQAAIDSNIVAVGTYQNNSFIKNNNDQLYFKFNTDGSHFLSNEKLVIDPTYGKNLASVQLLESLYNKLGRATLVVTGPTTKSLANIDNSLGQVKNLGRLSGDGLVVDENDNVLSHRFKAPKNPAIAVVQQIAVNQETQIFIIFSVMILILLAAGIILIIRKNGIQFKKGGWRK